MSFSGRRTMRGQASAEMALALLFGVLPLTLGLIAFAEAAWTYHGLTTITRLGARYAATHCFEDSSGQNVVSWLTDLNNPALPVFPDRQQLAGGGIQITVQYWTHDPDQGSIPVTCNESCSAECIPDSVTVSVGSDYTGYYTVHRILASLGGPAIQLPAFSTTVPMESGVDPN